MYQKVSSRVFSRNFLLQSTPSSLNFILLVTQIKNPGVILNSFFAVKTHFQARENLVFIIYYDSVTLHHFHCYVFGQISLTFHLKYSLPLSSGSGYQLLHSSFLNRENNVGIISYCITLYHIIKSCPLLSSPSCSQ